MTTFVWAAFTGAAAGCGVFAASDCAEKAACTTGSQDDGTSSLPPGDSDSEGRSPMDASTGDGADAVADARRELSDAPAAETADSAQDATGVDGAGADASVGCGFGLTCAPAVPTGWAGPAAFAEAAAPAIPPACGAGYGKPTLAYAGLDPPAPATCGGCACSASGQVCSAQVNVDASASCNGPCPSFSAPSGVCAAMPACSGLSSTFSLASPVPVISGGACVPTTMTPMPTIPPVSWATTAQLCLSTGAADGRASCGSGGECFTAPNGSYGTKACVYSTSDPAPATCPVGYAATRPMTFYRGVDDTRTCTACTCASNAPQGGSCAGTMTVFSQSACTGTASAAYTMGSACKTLSASPKPVSLLGIYSVASPGTCAAGATPQPIGAVVPSMPITVCCM